MENKPCHFLEKLLFTKAIYQLNKYNKALLNTNLAKTQTSSRNCLKYFEKRMASIHGKFFTRTCLHTLRLQKRGFLYETGFLPGLKFSTSHIICVLSVLLSSFWIDCLRTKHPRFRRSFLKSRQMRWYIYIHTNIFTSKTYKIKRDLPVSWSLITILSCHQSGRKESHEMRMRVADQYTGK